LVSLLSRLASDRFEVQKAVRSICDDAGVTIYGSFANATFHLDADAWNTYSDLDLASTDTEPDHKSCQIASEIEKRIGLSIKTKIRKSTNHIDRLPPSVCQQLSFIDTAIAFVSGVETRGLYHYLLVKYLLRTVYIDRYLRYDVDAIDRDGNDGLFAFLMNFKMTGSGLTVQDLYGITSELNVSHAGQFGRMVTLLSIREIEDLTPYWVSFYATASGFGLSELIEDISQKVELAKCAGREFNGYVLQDDVLPVGNMWPLTLRIWTPPESKIDR